MNLLRKFNLLYFLIPFMVYGLLRIYAHFGSSSVVFYGFAENQETLINLDHPVVVNKIYVSPGQFVGKGTLMMELTRTALDFEMNNLRSDIAETEAQDKLARVGLQAELQRLYAEKLEKKQEIQAQIDQFQAEQSFNKTLFGNLKSIAFPDTTGFSGATPQELRYASLQKELSVSLAAIDTEIEGIQNKLGAIGNPANAVLQKYRTEIGLQEKEAARLKLYAPFDGIAGYVHVKEGENVSAFNTLISFYEKSPTIVVAYVHESLILQIKTGDSVNVISGLHPEEHRIGYVTGLGHRMVEIPERLRKIPEIKAYGREVVVRISPDNNFLQKEKVMLEWLHPPDSSFFQTLGLTSNKTHHTPWQPLHTH